MMGRFVRALALLGACSYAAPLAARPFRVSEIPNGRVASCLTCHVYPGGPRNEFGTNVENYGGVGFLVNGHVQWGAYAVVDPAHPNDPPKRLADLDSDGDGRTNGEELLDASSSWSVGQPDPGRRELVRLPGSRDAAVVIRQIYVAGGASGAIYQHDFVELFNRSNEPVSLDGWSLQYAPATGSQVFGSNATNLSELPSVVLLPGQSYLVVGAPGGVAGSPVLGDSSDSTPLAFDALGGKIALVRQAGSLACNGSPLPCSAAQATLIVDWVGYGNAQAYEGLIGPAPTPTSTQASTRAGGGCIDTDNGTSDNSRVPPVLADFTLAPPALRTTASPRTPCDGTAPPAAPTVSALGAGTTLRALLAAALLLAAGLFSRRGRFLLSTVKPCT
jgi:hypothetical protein